MTPPRQPKSRTIKARIVPPVRLPRKPKVQPAPERPTEGQGDERRPNAVPQRQPQPPLAESASALPLPFDARRSRSRYPSPSPVVWGVVEHGTVYEPEGLAIADHVEAMLLIAELTPPQRVRQALAQAAWLNSYGYPSNLDEILTMWGSWEEGRRAA